MPPSLLPHHRQQRPHQPQRPKKIRLHIPPHLIHRALLQRPDQTKPRIVHQHVHPSKHRHRLRSLRLQIRLPNIQRHHPTAPLKLLLPRLQSLHIPARHHHPIPPLQSLPRNRMPEPAATSCNQPNFAFRVIHPNSYDTAPPQGSTPLTSATKKTGHPPHGECPVIKTPRVLSPRCDPRNSSPRTKPPNAS